ncbi:diguanylate cyclase [Sedimenticola sp.]|uniref:GGDEF domain-containing protein n=1 Tax=Sedimenticola sp. TaxID=1940285 RepID=UPI003D146715
MNFVTNSLKSICTAFGVHTWEQAYELLCGNRHTLSIQQHRAELLLNRIFFFSSTFAVLTPAWILVDGLIFPWPLWVELAVLRILAGVVFLAIAWQTRRDASLMRARILLITLLFLPYLFYFVADFMLSRYGLTGIQSATADIYRLLPFVIIAGLSLFPLTLIEFGFYALPLLALTLYSVFATNGVEFNTAVSTVWLFLLILGVSLISSLNQLRYMISLTSQAAYDVLTGALTRRAGIEAMELQFRLAKIRGENLAVAFLDLDHFKSLNDTFGHQAGDMALRGVGDRLQETVRKIDTVVRWGGEEFILIFPGASCAEARVVLGRLIQAGLGHRPNGEPLTASIGVAELRLDKIRHWKELLALADSRMYRAKDAGRARCLDSHDHELAWHDQTDWALDTA